MKDITIKGSVIKKELLFWFISFAVAVCINVYAIIKYNTSWIELISQIHVLILLSILIYLVILVIRGIISAVRRVIKNR